METTIYYGEIGKGKTYHVKQLYPNAVYFNIEQSDKLKTYGVIERVVTKKNKPFRGNEIKLAALLKKFLKNKEQVIIDDAELLSDCEFNLIINGSGNSHIILIFNLSKSECFNNENFNNIINSARSIKSIIDYEASKLEIISWLEQNYENLSSEDYEKVIKLTNANFINLNKLKIMNHNSSKITQDNWREYFNIVIKELLNKLDNECAKTLKQSSVIGESFDIKPLEHSKGFYQLNANEHIRELEKMKVFIQSSIDNPDNYCFIDSEIHHSIYNDIATEIKINWLEILKNYYFALLDCENKKEKKIFYLVNILDIDSKLKNTMENNDVIKVYMSLITLYEYIGDIKKAFYYSINLFKRVNRNSDDDLKNYLLSYIIKNGLNIGAFAELAMLLGEIKSFGFYEGSSLFLEYCKAQIYYNNGDIDNAYKIINDLQVTLKRYHSESDKQIIHSLVYSFAATLQNHLKIDDDGDIFFRLALNNSIKKLSDQSIFYGILKNCSMFWDYRLSKDALIECVEFYESKKMNFNLAEVSFNLGTEMLFHEGYSSGETKNYLEKAEEIFSIFPNEKFAYAKNNVALYYLTVENNIEKAITYLNEAMCSGLSNFTTMTILQNICECLILQNKINSDDFNQKYTAFNKCIKELKERANSTRYENIYKIILDLIIRERTNPDAEFSNLCLKEMEQAPDKFFKDIIADIYARNNNQPVKEHSSNKFYFNALNSKKVFLTEFRFWE